LVFYGSLEVIIVIAYFIVSKVIVFFISEKLPLMGMFDVGFFLITGLLPIEGISIVWLFAIELLGVGEVGLVMVAASCSFF